MHIGFAELAVVLALILFIAGPKQLPKLSRACGRAIASFKRGVKEDVIEEADDVEETIDEETV